MYQHWTYPSQYLHYQLPSAEPTYPPSLQVAAVPGRKLSIHDQGARLDGGLSIKF